MGSVMILGDLVENTPAALAAAYAAHAKALERIAGEVERRIGEAPDPVRRRAACMRIWAQVWHYRRLSRPAAAAGEEEKT
jgi:hypothetical protein